MNSKLDAHALLQVLAQWLDTPQRQANGTLLCGALGAARCRARVLPHGLTVALQLTRPWTQASAACLLLAAAAGAVDDALYLADDRLWLLRRYPSALREVEFDLLLKQQQTVRALLNGSARNIRRCEPHSVGRYA